MVDSHGGRGIGVTQVLGSVAVPVFAFVADAFAVLDLLKTHPGIDPERIGVMGFSKGGATALLAADERAARALSPSSSMFALHVAIYPGCQIYPEKPRLRGPQVVMAVSYTHLKPKQGESLVPTSAQYEHLLTLIQRDNPQLYKKLTGLD